MSNSSINVYQYCVTIQYNIDGANNNNHNGHYL